MYADVFNSRYGSEALIPLAAWLPTVIGAGLGYLGTRSSNAAAAREAERNRQFQLDASNTAHQRQVRDLRMAGLHPMLSANQGASAPSGGQAQFRDVGEGVSRGVASALAIKQAKANIELTESQALESRTRAYDLQTSAPLRYEDIAVRIQQGKLDSQQRAELIPLVVARAREEIALTTSSARRAAAAAALDEAARTGALNQQEFERTIGEAGPWLRLFFELMRSTK